MAHRNMVGLFAASVVVSIFTACGEQVHIDRDAGSGNEGGSSSSTGGKTSSSSGTAAGSTSASSGGSTAIESPCCDGISTGGIYLAGFVVQIVTATSCDVPLQTPIPLDTNGSGVELNCTKVPVNLDAGTADGFYIDYNQSPAHLELTGSYCTDVLTNGPQCMSVSYLFPMH
jgi:hypothetical protein